MHAVFAERFDAHPSVQAYDPADRPTRNEVRVTKHCSPDRCEDCASIETTAIHSGTLEMFQTPMHSTCPYSVHVYASESVSLEYLSLIHI